MLKKLLAVHVHVPIFLFYFVYGMAVCIQNIVLLTGSSCQI